MYPELIHQMGARADGPLPARCRSVPPGPGGPHPPASARADGDRAAAERLPRGARAPRSPSWSGRSPNRVSSALARVFAVWRTGLPRPVLVLQGGDALNYFGTGLILPFEIIYLHAVPRLLDGDRGAGAGDGHGHGRSGNAPFGCPPRSFQCETDPDRGQCLERTRLRGLGVCRPSLARLCLLGRRWCRLWTRGNRRPSPDLDPGPGGAARHIDRAPTSRRQLRSRPRRDGCGLHRRSHPLSPPGVPGSLPLRRSHVRRLRAGCARLDPGSWPRRMLRRRARAHGVSELLLGIGSCSP